jgi:hypothetical protein
MIPRRRLHRAVFVAAGAYNLAWGCVSAVYPRWFYRLTGDSAAERVEVFAALGMVVGLYGLVYFEVARVPERGWPLAAAGLLGKLLGPSGVFVLVARGSWPSATLLVCVTNDFIWWIPFALYLIDAWPQFRVDLTGAASRVTPPVPARGGEMNTTAPS